MCYLGFHCKIFKDLRFLFLFWNTRKSVFCVKRIITLTVVHRVDVIIFYLTVGVYSFSFLDIGLRGYCWYLNTYTYLSLLYRLNSFLSSFL